MKNLLKFISIGLVLALALFSQATFLTSPQVEAADVAENDIDFMTQTAAATVLTHYKASSVNNTVAVYVRDTDLNKTLAGSTSWQMCAGRVGAFDNPGAADTNRNITNASIDYVIDNGDYTTSGSGSGASFILAIATNGAATIATDTTDLITGGCGFADNEVLTISNAALGNNTGVADLTLTVNGLQAQKADAEGKDIDNTTIFALDDGTAVESYMKKTNGPGAAVYTDYHKQEDSDGVAGRADSAAEIAATPHAYLGAKTSLVLNSLSVKQNNVTLDTNTVNENAGTFKVDNDVDDVIANAVIATYSFNAQQTYSGLAAGAKRVHITSTSDATGEWIEIAEVSDEGADDKDASYNAGSQPNDRSKMGHIDSAVFRGVVNINTDASAGAADNGVVWVQDGDTLTASYYEAKNATSGATGALIKSTTATIDSTAPSISNVSPADGTLSKDSTQNLSFTIEDAGSGFDKTIANFADNVSVTVNGCEIPSSNLQVTAHSTSSMTLNYAAAIDWSGVAKLANASDLANCQTGGVRASGGFNVATTSGPTALTSSTVHGTLFSWYISATDEAGNNKTMGKNTHNETTSVLDLRIDTKIPAATSVVGAKAWSSSDKKDVTDNSSVKITFDESLDSASVDASDFTVSGVGVTSSTIESVTFGGDGALTDTTVYLDLAADLGPNAKPKVKLVGQITDRAGNILKPSTTETTGKTLGTSTDGVKPTLSGGAVSAALIAKSGKSEITFQSNENLTKTGEPFAAARGTYASVTGGGKTSGTAGLVALDKTDAGNVAVTLSNPTSAKGTLKHGTAEDAIPMTKTGIYGMTIVGRDAANNVGVGGAIKVVEDVSASFVGSGNVLDAVANAGHSITIKLKKWPLADHDGDGSLEDSVTAITVAGSTPHNMKYVDGGGEASSAARGGFRWPQGLNTVSVAGAGHTDDNTGTTDLTYTFTSASTGVTNSNALCTGWSISVAVAADGGRTATVATPGAGTGCATGDTITIAGEQLEEDTNGTTGANYVITAGAVNGTVANASTPLATDAISAYVSAVNWSETEEITLTVTNDSNIIIAGGATVKLTYYYVDPAQVVELDLDAPEVTVKPANLGSTTDKTPSISFAWDDDEYAGDNNTTVTMTKATMKGPSDTTDILADVTTTDNKTFYYKPLADLANGDYTLTVSAKDAAGNEKKDQTSKFTVKDRTKTTIAMDPGWNLISIPATPADGAIDTVITNTQVETVLTYDPSIPGGWLTAVRDGDALVGTLTTIDAEHAYWIFQKNADDIKVDLPGYKGGAAAVPPAISIVKGWNLIPAVTLTIGESTVETTIDPDKYLLGLDWVKAKGWDAANEVWLDIARDLTVPPVMTNDNAGKTLNGNTITFGKGYWLYSNAAGTIIP